MSSGSLISFASLFSGVTRTVQVIGFSLVSDSATGSVFSVMLLPILTGVMRIASLFWSTLIVRVGVLTTGVFGRSEVDEVTLECVECEGVSTVGKLGGSVGSGVAS